MGGSWDAPRRRTGGYTLVEMLVVMGIILLMVTLVLLSISSMLRGAKMSNTVNQFVAAADEARTVGLTLRRTISVDLTRMDTDGKINRLTTVGAYVLDSFESNTIVSGGPNVPNNWRVLGSGSSMETVMDGSYAMKIPAGTMCFNHLYRSLPFEESQDYEVLLQARFKFSPAAHTGTLWRFAILGSLDEGTGGSYGMAVVPHDPTVPGSDNYVILESNGGEIEVTKKRLDPSSSVRMRGLGENAWYRVKFSIKRFEKVSGSTKTPTARLAGKLWVDGQMEPADWTVGPYDDPGTPLAAGYGGFYASGNAVVVDDVFFDMRAIRPLPVGLRVDMLFPESGIGFNAGQLVNPTSTSPYNFPIVFRPDGTAAKRYIIRLADMTSGGNRYLVIEQNTGRTRPADSDVEALKE